MFGWLRYFLAGCVAFAHAGLAGPGGHHIGVPAVVVFYLISGYVVSAQWQYFRQQPAGLASFYRDRALRVMPLYYLMLALAALYVTLTAHVSDFTARPWDAGCWASNLLIVPLDWFPYTGVDRCTYVPPAWSLGLEIQFYLLAPILLATPAIRNTALWVSVAVYAAASWGVLPTDEFGYRLLPGTLFMFLAGGLIEERVRRVQRSPGDRHMALLWLVIGAIGSIAWATGRIDARFNIETLVGFLVGLPLVTLVARWPRRAWDDWLAGVSYPLFLCHFMLIWAFRAAGLNPAVGASMQLGYIAALTALAAVLWHGCDQPLGRWRRTLRHSSVTAITVDAKPVTL